MNRHTPLRALYDVARHGNLIGYKCDHCGLILTESGTPSDPMVYVQGNRGIQGRYVRSRVHARRVQAARADRFRKRMQKALGKAA